MTEHDPYKIIDTVCEVYKTSYKALVKSSRKREYIYPRYACYYFLRKHTGLILVDIALLFGKNHATVVSGLKAYDDLMFFYGDIREKHDKISELLNKQTMPYISYESLFREYEKF
ncbi:MAG: hypothetical protein LBJ63_07630 [Prevotellaceae bacterium]|jgi:chromosomal replication initiation ATPase DnaA|nr:hypothetical protein [Prevotellaceae bacterium]